MKKIIAAIIPARSGSKAIKNKNIIIFNKKILIAHSILTAKKCRINKIILSTDSIKYREIGKKFGAEVPFLRPKKYSRDTSSDAEYIKHCYFWYLKNNIKIDIFIILRPTTPIRNFKIVNNALKCFIEKKLHFLRSAHEASESPLKWFRRNKNGFYKPISKNSNLKLTNQTRQSFEKVYIPNGYVDILDTSKMKKKNIYGDKMFVFVTKRTYEIDTKEDLQQITK